MDFRRAETKNNAKVRDVMKNVYSFNGDAAPGK
jgi:hypothetical protein